MWDGAMPEWFANLLAFGPLFAAMVALVAASAFFSSSETALFSLSPEELDHLRRGGGQGRLATRLLETPDRLLTAILFWNLVVNLSYFAVSVVICRGLITAGLPLLAGMVGAGSVGGIIVFGEVLPKGLAVGFRVPFARAVAFPLSAAVNVLTPILPALNALSRALQRAFWPNLKVEPEFELVDLERAIDELRERREVAEHERDLLQAVLDLAEVRAEELMWPRGHFRMATIAELANRWDEVVLQGRYVVLRDPASAADEAWRYLSLADWSLGARRDIADAVLRLSRPMRFVPWCAPLSDVWQEMAAHRDHVVGVVSEYGDTVGVITVEDLQDFLLDPEAGRARRLVRAEPVREVAPGVWEVDGVVSLRLLARRLGIPAGSIPRDVVTAAGLVQDLLDEIPRPGETANWQGWTIEVVDVQPRNRVRLRWRRQQA
ncbi:MAG: DUF21 domain-containing protein [Planctomycetota bacterium]|nr:MAG: DUF21 domain-containing protein [Planctomycetota bacterium]